MSVQYATISHKSAYLNTEFGEQYACRVFNLTTEELEQIVGRYSKGKRKGQLRGKLIWKTVDKGGWVKEGAMGHGHVERPGRRFGHMIVNAFDETKVIYCKGGS